VRYFLIELGDKAIGDPTVRAMAAATSLFREDATPATRLGMSLTLALCLAELGERAPLTLVEAGARHLEGEPGRDACVIARKLTAEEYERLLVAKESSVGTDDPTPAEPAVDSPIIPYEEWDKRLGKKSIELLRVDGGTMARVHRSLELTARTLKRIDDLEAEAYRIGLRARDDLSFAGQILAHIGPVRLADGTMLEADEDNDPRIVRATPYNEIDPADADAAWEAARRAMESREAKKGAAQ
jgi:hypothetical protein